MQSIKDQLPENQSIFNQKHHDQKDEQIELENKQLDISNDKKLTSQLNETNNNIYLDQNINQSGIFEIQDGSLGQSRMIRLNIDTQQNRKLTIIFTIFTLLIILVYGLSFTTPTTFLRQDQFDNICPSYIKSTKYKDEVCKFYETQTIQYRSFHTSKLTSFNQVLMLYMSPQQLDSNKQLNINFNLQLKYKINVYGVSKDQKVVSTIKNKEHSLQISCKALQKQPLSCNDQQILYLQELDYDSYIFTIEIINHEQASKEIKIIKYYSQTINPKFSSFLIVLRFLLLCMSFISFLYYAVKLNKIPSSEHVIEQRMILLLSVLLFLFNNPFSFVTVLLPNLFTHLLSAFYQFLFLGFVVLFWLVVFQSILKDQNQKKCSTVNGFNILFVSQFTVINIFSYVLIMYYFYKDPSVNLFDKVETHFIFVFVIYFINLIFLTLYVLYCYVQCCKKYKTLLHRHQLFFIVNSYFIFVILTSAYSHEFGTHYLSGARVLLTTCLTNLYIWFLAYLYCPTTKGIQEAQQYKDSQEILHNRSHVYQALNGDEDQEEMLFERQ